MLLAVASYDPAVAVTSNLTDAAKAMTALDTSNLRVTFTAPDNGKVLARCRFAVNGATTYPQMFVGILQGSTIIARKSVALTGCKFSSATGFYVAEAVIPISGLTPGNSYTWDLAYGVETGVASTAIKYGGPNDSTTANAYGSASISIWEAKNLLQSILYDPASAVYPTLNASSPLTAIDTANLRLSVNAPSSGKMLVQMSSLFHGATGPPQTLAGLLNGATVMARAAPGSGGLHTALVTTHFKWESRLVLSGLTPGNLYNLDAALGVETGVAGTSLKYGGPDNATADDAWGMFLLAAYAI